MTAVEPQLLALEKYFAETASKRQEEFPGTTDYWKHYSAMLTTLREEFYPQINVGLSVHSPYPNSIAGIYTDHSSDHFDEVVKYAGKLTGADLDPSPENFPLKPFEVFLLLMAIRLHDVGNLFGREGHEKKALTVYKQATAPASRDQFETQVIMRLAEVHGGTAADGTKDTISQLKESDHLGSSNPFRPRLVAALVRLADEICEHRGRVKAHLLEGNQIPAANLIFHLYAASIKSSVVNRREKQISIEYVLHKEHLLKPYEFPGRPEGKFLLDETLDRLAKLNHERIYCNQFLDPPLQINRIHASITIVDGEDYEKELDFREIDIKPPHGYPAEDRGWRSQVNGFSGDEMKEKLSQVKESAE